MGMDANLEALLGQAERLAAETRAEAGNVSAAVEDGARGVRLQADGGGDARPEDVEALRQAIEGACRAVRGAVAGAVVSAMEAVADRLFGMAFFNLPHAKPPFAEPDGPPVEGDDRLDEAGDPTTNPW